LTTTIPEPSTVFTDLENGCITPEAAAAILALQAIDRAYRSIDRAAARDDASDAERAIADAFLRIGFTIDLNGGACDEAGGAHAV
jgi:hypothetical protein